MFNKEQLRGQNYETRLKGRLEQFHANVRSVDARGSFCVCKGPGHKNYMS